MQTPVICAHFFACGFAGTNGRWNIGILQVKHLAAGETLQTLYTTNTRPSIKHSPRNHGLDLFMLVSSYMQVSVTRGWEHLGIWNTLNTTMAFMPHGSPSCHLPHHSYHTHDKWSRHSDHSQLAPGNGTCIAHSSSAGRRSSPAGRQLQLGSSVFGWNTVCSASGITHHLFL